MINYDYQFKTQKYQSKWRDILENTFTHMEHTYRKNKDLPMSGVLSRFKKVFGITPKTLKDSTDNALYRYKMLAIYLLVKYSKESFETIAREFHITVETVEEIDSNEMYFKLFEEEIKKYFNSFKEDYLLNLRSVLAFEEQAEIIIENKKANKKDNDA